MNTIVPPSTAQAGAALVTEAGVLPALSERGFAFLGAASGSAWLSAHGELSDWDAFAASWNNLGIDQHMADGGRYRRRRHAVFSARPGAAAITREPHQPHYQGVEYNRLNGGIERWFEPVLPEIADGATMRATLGACRSLFDALMPGGAWHIEAHQFRIEARPGESGQPTPEGLHRDGVDYVLVMMVERRNISRGETSIHDDSGALLGSFTLTDPRDIALVHDRRVFHGVTAVEPVDAAVPAWRDVLVVTFRAR